MMIVIGIMATSGYKNYKPMNFVWKKKEDKNRDWEDFASKKKENALMLR